MNAATKIQNKRASLPLTTKDLEDLALISSSPASREFLNITHSTSEAAVLHQIFSLGLQRAHELLDEIGYAQVAEDAEHRAFEEEAARRRR